MAGTAKVLDRGSTRQGIAGFGVPRRLVTPVSVALPIAEVAVAAALVDSASAVAGAGAALALLALFMVGIGIALARGTQPDCRCFGRLHSAAVGRRTLARDAVLAAAAALVALGGPGAGLRAWAAQQRPLDWAAIFVAMVLAVAFVVEGSQLVARWRRRPSGTPSSPGYPQTLSTAGDNRDGATGPSRSESSGR